MSGKYKVTEQPLPYSKSLYPVLGPCALFCFLGQCFNYRMHSTPSLELKYFKVDSTALSSHRLLASFITFEYHFLEDVQKS